jgi:hypothetical protein
MKRLILYISLFFVIYNSYGQHELQIKLAPLGVAHPSRSVIPISIELQKNKYGIEYEHGIKCNSLLNTLKWNRGKSNHTYFRSQINLRYYFNKKKNISQFVGLNFFYLPEKYDRKNDWYFNENGQYKYLSARIITNDFKSRIMYGLKFNTKNKFMFDLISGIGIQTLNINYKTTNEELTNADDFLWDEWISPRDRTSGNKIRPSILLTVKIGYILFTTKPKLQ